MRTALLNINVASSYYVCLRNFTVTEVLNKPHERKSQYKFAHNSISSQYLFLDLGGRSGGAMALGKLPVPGRPTMWIREGRACSSCGWGLFGHFYSHLSFLSSFSLSLGDGPIYTEILSQRAVKPPTNQPNLGSASHPNIMLFSDQQACQTTRQFGQRALLAGSASAAFY